MKQVLNQISEILNMKYISKIGLTRADNFSKWKSGARRPTNDDLRRLRGDIGRAITKLQKLENELSLIK